MAAETTEAEARGEDGGVVRTASELIEEARGYGLDVEAERCDLLILRADVMILRSLDEPLRGHVVERLNDGHPLPASLADAEAETAARGDGDHA